MHCIQVVLHYYWLGPLPAVTARTVCYSQHPGCGALLLGLCRHPGCGALLLAGASAGCNCSHRMLQPACRLWCTSTGPLPAVSARTVCYNQHPGCGAVLLGHCLGPGECLQVSFIQVYYSVRQHGWYTVIHQDTAWYILGTIRYTIWYAYDKRNTGHALWYTIM